MQDLSTFEGCNMDIKQLLHHVVHDSDFPCSEYGRVYTT